MSNIEEFLKRAAAMRAQQAQQAQQRPQPPQRTTQRTQPVPAPAMYAAEVMDAEILEEDEVSEAGVTAQVQRHLDNTSFQRRAQQFSSEVRKSDDILEAHLHSAFVHRLGSLGANTSAAEDSTLDSEENAAKAITTPSLDIAALLRSPESIRNAIILAEVLNPPKERWG